ncbi:MAG TPA: hypothetical protein VKG43_12275 [Acidimicrobiales bacterium]|nr:hypothetical protein [Acidimicrobiales bacterium]
MNWIPRSAALTVGVMALSASGIVTVAAATPVAPPRTAAIGAILAGGVPKGYILENSGLTGAPNGVQSSATASCPAGTVVLGGGLDFVSDVFGQEINSSFPSSTTTWEGDVNNTSGAAASFDVYALCAKAPKGYAIVSSSADNPPGSDAGSTVGCPVKTKVLGGGALSSSVDPTVGLNSSWPIAIYSSKPKTSGWGAYENNASASDATITAYAVCGKEPGYALVQGSGVDNPAGTSTEAVAICPGTSVPLDGGSHASSANLAVDINSSVLSVGVPGGWITLANNGSFSDDTVTPYVICAT